MTTKVFDAVHHFSYRCRGALFPAACSVAAALGDHHRKHGSRFRLTDAMEARENRDSQCHRPAYVLSAGGPRDILDLSTDDQNDGHGGAPRSHLFAVAAVGGAG